MELSINWGESDLPRVVIKNPSPGVAEVWNKLPLPFLDVSTSDLVEIIQAYHRGDVSVTNVLRKFLH